MKLHYISKKKKKNDLTKMFDKTRRLNLHQVQTWILRVCRDQRSLRGRRLHSQPAGSSSTLVELSAKKTVQTHKDIWENTCSGGGRVKQLKWTKSSDDVLAGDQNAAVLTDALRLSENEGTAKQACVNTRAVSAKYLIRQTSWWKHFGRRYFSSWMPQSKYEFPHLTTKFKKLPL